MPLYNEQRFRLSILAMLAAALLVGILLLNYVLVISNDLKVAKEQIVYERLREELAQSKAELEKIKVEQPIPEKKSLLERITSVENTLHDALTTFKQQQLKKEEKRNEEQNNPIIRNNNIERSNSNSSSSATTAKSRKPRRKSDKREQQLQHDARRLDKSAKDLYGSDN